MERKMFVFFLLSIFLMVSGESEECRLCESLLNEDDHCTFLLDESTETPPWSCPAVFPCGHIISINYNFLMNFHAIRIQRFSKCRKFIIVTQNFTRYTEFFQGLEKFAPYSKIVLLESGDDEAYEFSQGQIDHMYLNALHVLQVFQSPLDITVKNILTGAKALGNRRSIPNVTAVLKPNQLHPLIDNEFSRNEINVSLFHCPPFVVDKDPTNKEDITMNLTRFDGIEFRLMAYITRHWRRRFYVRNPVPNSTDPWASIVIDVTQRRSNVALCGLWLIEFLDASMDLSHPYGQQCFTLLVPRLHAVPRSEYIYLALSGQVWYIYLILMTIISLLVYYFVSVNTESFTVQFNLFTRSVMDIIAIATQHGITIFPRKYSARILIMSWFFFSILISSIYSTGYTSILTTSLFPKPIDTISDVISKNLKWSDAFGGHLTDEMEKADNLEFERLTELKIDHHSCETEKLIQSENYGQTISIISPFHVVGTERFENVSSKYRVMNSCIYKFYTVLAFQRNSPYTALFTKEIPKYLESGLIIYWMNLNNIRYGKPYIYTFFKDTKDTMRGPHTLTIENIAPGLYVLGIGLTISTAVFIVELLHFWKYGQKK